MTEPQYQLLVDLVIKPLKDKNANVFIFGSRTTNKHHSHSDVDLLYKLEKDNPLPPGYISQIKENIEESNFPFTIDLVAETDLAESYRDRVLQTRIKL